jgi:hypothetical protein
VSHTSGVSESRHSMITIATTVHGFSLDNIKANTVWTMYLYFFSHHCPKQLPHSYSLSALYTYYVNNRRPWVQFFPLKVFWTVGNDYSCTDLFIRIFLKDNYVCGMFVYFYEHAVSLIFLLDFHVMHFCMRFWLLLLSLLLLLLLFFSAVPGVVKLPDYGLWTMYLLGVWFVEFLNEHTKMGTWENDMIGGY